MRTFNLKHTGQAALKLAPLLVLAAAFSWALPAQAAKLFALPSSDFSSLEGAAKTDAHFEDGGWLIHSIPLVGDMLYGCPGLDSSDPECTLVVLPIRTVGSSIEKWYLDPNTGAAWITVSAAPLGDYLFACYEPGSNPHCKHVKLKSRPPGAGLSRFDADVGGGPLPGLALPGLGGGDKSATDAAPVVAPHPDEFWLEASLMVPGPVNLYACRGLSAKDAKCTLAINALTFVQREDFGMSKLEAVDIGKKKRKTGILVGKVAEDSAAAKAGLSEGDVIVKAGGFSLYSPLHLKGVLAQIAAGKKIKLTLSSGDNVTLKRSRKRSSKK